MYAECWSKTDLNRCRNLGSIVKIMSYEDVEKDSGKNDIRLALKTRHDDSDLNEKGK